jgi:transcriptional regulator with XRE-family HTH domain
LSGVSGDNNWDDDNFDDDDFDPRSAPAHVVYARQENLVATTDPDSDKEVYRKPGFDGVTPIDELDARASQFLKSAREKRGLKQGDTSSLLGLSQQVYGRYERNLLKLNLNRVIVLSEVLGFHPTEMLFSVAPHLFGGSQEAAAERAELYVKLANLPDELIHDLLAMITQVEKINRQANRKRRH